MGSRFDTVFRISIILKGLDAAIEVIGGALLLFVTRSDITHFVAWLTRSTLAHNPHNYIAVHLNSSAEHLAADSTLIGAIYLLSHGIVKLFVVVLISVAEPLLS